MDRCIGRCISVGWFGLRHRLWVVGLVVAGSLGIAPVHAQQMCDGQTYPFPYTDVSAVGAAFCPGIMEAYVTGISKGTSPTMFSPNDSVIRVAMTTFLQRSVDQVLVRPSRRAALNQWWTPQNTAAMQTVSGGGLVCATDGRNIWGASDTSVNKVDASTGKVLGTWTGGGYGVAVAAGKVFLTGENSPGSLYVIDPTQPPGATTIAANNLGNYPVGIAFDGTNLWTANQGVPSGSVSIITPQATPPYPVTTVTTGFQLPWGILYDGANIWVTDNIAGKLFKLDAGGTILQTVTVGVNPGNPAFDGTNIWVPNYGSSSITVVQASTGNVVATINSDGTNNLIAPVQATFDGERILVTNVNGESVTLFKAADLTFIANVSTGAMTQPQTACSDGINFWIPLFGTGMLRF